MITLKIRDKFYHLNKDEDRLFTKLAMRYDQDEKVEVFIDGELDPCTKEIGDIFNF